VILGASAIVLWMAALAWLTQNVDFDARQLHLWPSGLYIRHTAPGMWEVEHRFRSGSVGTATSSTLRKAWAMRAKEHRR
jgi:hypothetical protein